MNSDIDNKAANLAENKVLILYLLTKTENGIIEDGLYKIVNSINNMNYFYFKDILIDLINSGLVGVYANDDSEEILKITKEGEENLELTKEALPGLVKLKADNIFPKEFSSLIEELSISAEYTPKNENEYLIKCRITENNETIFEVKTFAGSQEMAQKIVNNWNNNASEVYPQILEILFKDYEKGEE